MKNTKEYLVQLAFKSVLVGVALCSSQMAIAAPNLDFMDGCNWADPRDNYVNGILIYSGVGASSAASVHKAKAVELAGYAKSHGMNSVRIPTNPDTIANADQWNKFKNRVSGLDQEGMNTLITHWDGAGTNKDGKLDDRDDWDTMWQTINAQYQSWSKVYFSPFNEPFGLTKSELKNLFHNGFIDVIGKGDTKILINGTGYDDNVKEIAAFPAFDNCGFSQHIYPWYGNHTTNAGWSNEVKNRVGSADYSATVVTEFGVQSIATRDFQSGSTGDGAVEFVRGITQACKDVNMGCMYWPGWRSGDSFRLWENEGSNTVRNESLMDRLEYGFD